MSVPECFHALTPWCPHCHALQRDAWEIDFGPCGDGDTTTACGTCGTEFSISRHVHVTYSTAKIQPKA